MTFTFTLCTEKKKPRFDQNLDVLKGELLGPLLARLVANSISWKKKNEALKIEDIVSYTRNNYIMGKIIKIRTVDNVSYKGEGRLGEKCGHNMNAILNSELWTMCTTK